MRGAGAHEQRFAVLIDDLLTTADSHNPSVQANYLWGFDSQKKTLKEFEKEIYYTNGDYEKAYSDLFKRRLLVGQHEFKKQIGRDEEKSHHHYIWGQQGFKCSGHLSAPGEEAQCKKMKKLGHVKEKKLVGWDLQKPRDNRMYYIGEGGANLRKLDKHIKRKQGNILNLFSTNVINDN